MDISLTLCRGDEQLQLSEFLERLFAAAGGNRKRPRLVPDRNPYPGLVFWREDERGVKEDGLNKSNESIGRANWSRNSVEESLPTQRRSSLAFELRTCSTGAAAAGIRHSLDVAQVGMFLSLQSWRSQAYGFEPTPLDEVLHVCVEFFEAGCATGQGRDCICSCFLVMSGDARWHVCFVLVIKAKFPEEAKKAALKLPSEPAATALKIFGCTSSP